MRSSIYDYCICFAVVMFVTLLAGPARAGAQLAIGDGHMCAINDYQELSCWGTNTHGALGNGTNQRMLLPDKVIALGDSVSQVATGLYHSCALNSAGQVYCWGFNDNGELGLGHYDSQYEPVAVPGLAAPVSQIAANLGKSCFIDGGGGLSCVGANWFGQLGDGSEETRTTPVAVQGFSSGTVQVATGGYHSCALNSSGAVYCWGNNALGQLGNGSTDQSTVPVAVLGLESGVVAISAGHLHSCALLNSGAVRCWGNNNFGELGDGSAGGYSDLITSVSGLPDDIVSVQAGRYFSCALSQSGQVYCWGRNDLGQVGDLFGAYYATAQLKPGLSGTITQLVVNYDNACALNSDKVLACWGKGDNGQLGDGQLFNRALPVVVRNYPEAPKFDDIALTDNGRVAVGAQHACAIDRFGSLKCWGLNTSGQLGNGSYEPGLAATAVTALRNNVRKVSAGIITTCTILRDGAAHCWGHNESGDIGDGSYTTRNRPTTVGVFASGAADISAGNGKACLVDAGGQRHCWGSNFDGGLGLALDTGQSRLTPTALNGEPAHAAAVEVGMGNHACMVLNSGAVNCWGYNSYGQLGNNSYNPTLAPVAVTGLPFNASTVTSGSAFSCASLVDGSVWCWGRNNRGQLGSGDYADSPIPLAVQSLPEAISKVAAANESVCALGQSGTLYCWGSDAHGQLGRGAYVGIAPLPLAIASLPGAQSIIDFDAGTATVCALTSLDAMYCWGRGWGGILGNGGSSDSPAPVLVNGFYTEQGPELYIIAEAKPSAAGNVSCSALSVSYGGSVSCSAQPNPGYRFERFNLCPQQDCSLSDIRHDVLLQAFFSAEQYQVGLGPLRGGSVEASAQTVGYGQLLTYTLTAATGYRIRQQVGGTCPAGQWLNDNTYQTGAITSACTVLFRFERIKARRKFPLWLLAPSQP
ncbi:InlB B-repeat-containing protein [Rheinheimera pleomorphica]|uniref:RCC1 domain-containing protein n=1 Tax=Rheinheimera pleomorphica TaxID=2703963 RepID=UPI001420D2A1|nr:RCC1 repeat-containing protein [Rheinheimera pleomorphica]